MYGVHIEWLVRLGLTLLLATAACLAVHGSLGTVAAALTFAVAGGLFAVVLMPVTAENLRGMRNLLLWALLAGWACALPALLASGLTRSLAIGGTLLLFIIAFGTLKHWISAHTNEATATAWILLILLTLAAAPLYLGGLAEHHSQRGWLVNTIVNMSPVSHLAVALDVDYLRSNWFYSHSRLGSLRFDYLAPGVNAAGYILLALVLQALTHLQFNTQRNTQS